MEEFLRYVLSQLVEYPDEIVLTRVEKPGEITFYLAARKTDLPKIIGKGGHTIQALRTLLAASGQKHETKVALEIVE